MDADVRELFAHSVRDATEKHTGAPLDAALVDIGWRDALASDGRDAVSPLFEQQGASKATSSALDAVIVDALGVAAGGAVLPALGATSAPATVAGERLFVDGLALAEH